MPRHVPESSGTVSSRSRPGGEAPISRIAKDLGVSEPCLPRWLRIADVEGGTTRCGPGLRFPLVHELVADRVPVA